MRFSIVRSRARIRGRFERVLLEFFQQVPGLRVRDKTVKAKPGVDPNDVLSQSETHMVQVLPEHGGIMATFEFKSAYLDMGMNRQTLGRGVASSRQ